MILFELLQTENNEIYQKLQLSNNQRQYHFLQSIIEASLSLGRPFLSSQVLKALNFHAITCLHTNAGEYRPCEVSVGNHQPPPPFSVQALMDDFVNEVNFCWERTNPVSLAAFVLWRLNHIHPFINGNGRTARAACYFILCVKAGGHVPGNIILPELIKRERSKYVAALQLVDDSLKRNNLNLSPLVKLLEELLNEQIQSAPIPAG